MVLKMLHFKKFCETESPEEDLSQHLLLKGEPQSALSAQIRLQRIHLRQQYSNYTNLKGSAGSDLTLSDTRESSHQGQSCRKDFIAAQGRIFLCPPQLRSRKNSQQEAKAADGGAEGQAHAGGNYYPAQRPLLKAAVTGHMSRDCCSEGEQRSRQRPSQACRRERSIQTPSFRTICSTLGYPVRKLFIPTWKKATAQISLYYTFLKSTLNLTIAF